VKTPDLLSPRWKLLILVAAIAGLGASSWHYSTNARRLEAGVDNLCGCEQLAKEIGDAQQSPQRASLKTWSQDDLGTAVESAAAEAHLARDRVLRIDPQAPKRLGKTDYLEQATEVELSAVTLRQLVDFLFVVANRDDQLEIGTLRMRVPHETGVSAEPETWLADVVLTQRIYAPTTPQH
jgi:hypothetical protein